MRLTLPCGSGNGDHNVEWIFCSIVLQNCTVLYSQGQLCEQCSSAFTVDDSNSSSLIVFDVGLSKVGYYVCFEDDGFGRRLSENYVDFARQG